MFGYGRHELSSNNLQVFKSEHKNQWSGHGNMLQAIFSHLDYVVETWEVKPFFLHRRKTVPGNNNLPKFQVRQYLTVLWRRFKVDKGNVNITCLGHVRIWYKIFFVSIVEISKMMPIIIREKIVVNNDLKEYLSSKKNSPVRRGSEDSLSIIYRQSCQGCHTIQQDQKRKVPLG